MIFSFKNPLLLLLLLPCAGFTAVIYLKYKKYRLYKGFMPAAVRLLILLMLILSIAGMELKTLVDDVELIFVADLSDSTLSTREDILDFIRDSLRILPDNYKTGIVGFGGDAQVEHMLTDFRGFSDFHITPNTSLTNIDAALQRAEALFSSASRKRIVLLTDGSENAGDGMMRAKILRQHGIRVDGVLLETRPPAEVQLSDLRIPASLYQGESYGVRVVIDSTVETRGTLKLFADRTVVGMQTIELQKGTNVFVFDEKAVQIGTIVYEAELEAADDTFRQNNRMSAFTRIKGPAQVAIVEGTEGEGRELAKILEAGGCRYKVFTPNTMPEDLEELVKYDAVILANVDYEKLREDKAKMLDTYVKSLGKGLLTTGGDSSYILGGYLGTPLEKLLPVEMELKNKEENPSLALLLVIDKSGSMSGDQFGISKMDLAKEAAIRSLEVLRETDYIGIVAFDSMAYWVVDTQKAKDKDSIGKRIATMAPGGGTNLSPGLQFALASLSKVDAAFKHVIVLTDGQTEQGNITGLIRQMTEEDITISAVAVGDDADTRLMQRIAELGNGRYYFTNDFASIPKIFTKETYLAKRDYINNETFYPKVAGYSPILQNITAIPPLHGYIAATPKAGAEVVLQSSKDDPVLASWTYGLGKVASWMSDTTGIWTEDWMTWSGSADFWLNTLSYILPGESTGSAGLEVERDGSLARISLTTNEGLGIGGDSKAVIVDPEGNERTVALNPLKPGYHQGSFQLDKTGVYLIRVEQNSSGVTSVIETGLNYPYSPEYDMRLTSSKAVLEHIVNQTDGRIVREAEELLQYEEPPVWKHTEIWPYLLAAALIIFIYDIAARKLEIGRIAGKMARRAKDRLVRLFGALSRYVVNSWANRSANIGENSPQPDRKTSEAEQPALTSEGEDRSKTDEKGSIKDAPGSDDFTSELLKARRKSKIKG